MIYLPGESTVIIVTTVMEMGVLLEKMPENTYLNPKKIEIKKGSDFEGFENSAQGLRI